MIRHCVLLRFTDDATDGQRQALLDGLVTMPERIDAIERYDFGVDAGLGDGNWDLAVTADFADEAGYRAYAQDPAHVELIRERIKPILADRVAVQFELGP